MGLGSYTGTTIPTNVSVGKYSSIAPGCNFHVDGDHLCIPNKKCVFTTNWSQPEHPRDIIIGNDVWIGQGVKILEGVTIGDGAIIGAHTVLSKDVPPYSVVVGNSQRITRFRFDFDQIIKLLNIKWWDWEESLITERRQDMLDIDLFLTKYSV